MTSGTQEPDDPLFSDCLFHRLGLRGKDGDVYGAPIAKADHRIKTGSPAYVLDGLLLDHALQRYMRYRVHGINRAGGALTGLS